MAKLITTRQQALDHVEGCGGSIIYAMPNDVYVPTGNGTWQLIKDDAVLAQDVWSVWASAAENERTTRVADLLARMAQTYEAVGVDEIADDLLAGHLACEGIMEYQQLVDGTEQYELSLEEAVAIIGEERAEEIAMSELRDYCSNDDLVVRVDYYGDEGKSNVSHADIDDWVNGVAVNDWMDEEHVTHDRDGFVSYFTAKIEESSWYPEERWRIEDEAAKRVAEGLARAVEEMGQPYLGLDAFDVTQDVRERYVLDSELYVDPDVEGIVSGYGDVLVDIFLCDGDERNVDFSNLPALRDYLDDPDSYTTEEVDGLLRDNGLSWLAEQQGHARDALIRPLEGDGPANEYHEEMVNYPNYGSMAAAVIIASLSLEDYIMLVEAKDKGSSITLWGNDFLAGIFDRWNGGGSDLNISVRGPITIPPENLFDIALDGMERVYDHYAMRQEGGWVTRYTSTAQLVSEYGGYTIDDTYGLLEGAWHRGFATSDLAMGRHVEDLVEDGRLEVATTDAGALVMTQDRLVNFAWLPNRFPGEAVRDDDGNVELTPTACATFDEIREQARRDVGEEAR